jgi:hypothetical protein
VRALRKRLRKRRADPGLAEEIAAEVWFELLASDMDRFAPTTASALR